MDDDRIERALRQGPPDEPAYERRVRDRISTADGDRAASRAQPVAIGSAAFPPRALDDRSVRRRSSSPSRRSWPVGIAAAIVVLVAAGAVLGQIGVDRTGGDAKDALARIQAAGTVRVAVRAGAPQTLAAGGSWVGFDVDVARAIADELGVRASITAVSDGAFGRNDWDLAMTGAAPSGTDTVKSEPYAYWPAWLVAPAGSAIARTQTVEGARVCVVRGSAGQEKLSSSTAGTSARVITVADDDTACLDQLRAGSVDATVTSTLTADEIPALGSFVVVGDPVAVEPWSLTIVPTATDPDSLRDAVDAGVERLRATGQLAELSRRSFGGADVTIAQP